MIEGVPWHAAWHVHRAWYVLWKWDTHRVWSALSGVVWRLAGWLYDKRCIGLGHAVCNVPEKALEAGPKFFFRAVGRSYF